MRPTLKALAAIWLTVTPPAAADEADTTAAEGALTYRTCSSCHSLAPGVHLTGPSLAGLWGAKAGRVEGFGRYSAALKGADLTWDDTTLDAWLTDPEALLPGTAMKFAGIGKAETRAALIAFLRIALAPDGLATVVARELASERVAKGQVPPDISGVASGQRVTAIRHCGDAYFISAGTTTEWPVWETNLRIKIDTSARGPGAGGPVLLKSGTLGDRVSIVFASVDEARRMLVEKC